MRSEYLLILLAGLLFIGCEKKTASNQPTNQSDSTGNPLTAPADYLGAAAKAQRSAGKLTETLGIKQAIAQFSAVEGRYPKDLQELVTEKYIPSLPKPPPGKQFTYNPTNGEVSLK